MITWIVGLVILVCIWESRRKQKLLEKRNRRIEELKVKVDRDFDISELLKSEEDLVVQVKIEEYQKSKELERDYN
ncbi:hypothetical protein [Vibrio sp. TBV020]|uniref:hypothetical protein n=1 Tax=Vibrio sp. TBV020 TaxID=3137398 RepID=UPI0038CD7FB5